MIQEDAGFDASRPAAYAAEASPDRPAAGVRIEQCEFEALLERAMQVLGPQQHLPAPERKTYTNFRA